MKNDPLKISGMHDGASPSVFKNASKLRQSMTKPEVVLWEYLKTKPMGYKFRRQHPIAGYVLDFYCHKLRLSIEVDGEYHLNKEQFEKDEERTLYLKSVGIKELRFTNQEVTNEMNKIKKIIDNFLIKGIPSGTEGKRE